MKLGKIGAWLAARARERSTWLGLLAFAGVVGVQISPENQAVIAQAAAALAGLVLAGTADKGAAA